MNGYENKLKREQDWHTQSAGFKADHPLNSPVFYSTERCAYNAGYARRQLGRFIGEIIAADRRLNPRILIAPIGFGGDVPYVRSFSNRISGIDLSQEAIDRIAGANIDNHVGDMKHMTMFGDNTFDLVLISQFFHHFLEFGFDDFIREAYRVLRPGGHLVSFEPNILHPAAFGANCLKKVVGNITGTVEDEAPFNPVRLTRAMRRCGFTDVKVFATGFSHHRTPIPLAKLINGLTSRLLRFPVLKYFAYYCFFEGRKP